MSKSYSVNVENNEEIITEATMALIPKYELGTGNLHCTILGQYGVKEVKQNPLAIVKESCIFYGSDFKGSINSARKILRKQRNLPIMVSLTFKLCMIPLSSPMKEDCSWIALRHVEETFSNRENSIILFSNGQQLNVNISWKVLEDRINKAGRLISTYDYRYEKMKDLYITSMVAEGREDDLFSEQESLYRVQPSIDMG
ncbi:competence protein ComK [uncultured Metabacillus sp.]|uniref:competence protein ComK n=1 Tax=uncultured Metabacillus sp. TaxID=2860135 RepID=UPI0026056624|nr:competence protein ComK [uncultured Metabacillus sp.]